MTTGPCDGECANPEDGPGGMPLALRLSEGLGNTAPAVDWAQHRYSDGVLCEFRPRAEYKDRATKPGMAEKAGTRFVLRTMWLMDEDDSYPGEYALSTVDSCGGLMETLGIAWVASGDVVVLPNVRANAAPRP
jgi:hypothetical protein